MQNLSSHVKHTHTNKHASKQVINTGPKVTWCFVLSRIKQVLLKQVKAAQFIMLYVNILAKKLFFYYIPN